MMKDFHEREKAATTIQTIFRGRRVRRMQADTKSQKAAIKIQVFPPLKTLVRSGLCIYQHACLHT